MIKITQLPAWKKLEQHYPKTASLHMRELFQADQARTQKFSCNAECILLDYSKNRITSETLDLLVELAKETELPSKIQNLYAGHTVNRTENRAALHTALRSFQKKPVFYKDENISALISQTLSHMQNFVEKLYNGQHPTYTGKRFTDIVNIGIGGSDLGPKMAIKALAPYVTTPFNFHFLSNIDGYQLEELLSKLSPDTTLFIITSKTFTTQETLLNAEAIKHWFCQSLPTAAIGHHVIAVTAATEKAKQFGIHEENIFPMWDWVGGRYSIWSAVGLSLFIAIGPENFYEFLRGAEAMDDHFKEADLNNNMPVLLALLTVWYTHFFECSTHAILPYREALSYFPDYLQQLIMESNGKSVTQAGDPLEIASSPIVWGGIGTNGQHAFHQLLHQGSFLVPTDFITFTESNHNFGQHHRSLYANCLSQSQALMLGKTPQEAFQELINRGYSEKEALFLAPHKATPGNRPSNTLLLKELTPYTLGNLIALYEHKVYAHSVLLDINAFDQWGVEYGKQLTETFLKDLNSVPV